MVYYQKVSQVCAKFGNFFILVRNISNAKDNRVVLSNISTFDFDICHYVCLNCSKLSKTKNQYNENPTFSKFLKLPKSYGIEKSS